MCVSACVCVCVCGKVCTVEVHPTKRNTTIWNSGQSQRLLNAVPPTDSAMLAAA